VDAARITVSYTHCVADAVARVSSCGLASPNACRSRGGNISGGRDSQSHSGILNGAQRNAPHRNVEESEKFAPALVEIEDALVPAFVVEEHTDGRYTVFVPSAPTPAVGVVYIIARARVHIVDAPFMKTVKCISSWGVGSKDLVLAIRDSRESAQL
jgi:hypothetical protein